MSKLPSFQFYIGDWQKDPNLRRATKAEKGVLIEMLCLMYECEDRGVFITGGMPWSDNDVAAAIGGDISENLTCLSELLRKGIVSRNQAGAIFSRRMVRDEQKRLTCVEAGKLGGNPTLNPTLKGGVNHNAKGPPKRNLTPSSSSSSSSSDITPENADPEGKPVSHFRAFEELWRKAYEDHFKLSYKHAGGRDGKAVAALMKVEGYTPEKLIDLAIKAWGKKESWVCREKSKTIYDFEHNFNQIQVDVLASSSTKSAPVLRPEIK